VLLDATSEHLIPGVLPERCLNFSGWVIQKPAGFWIDLSKSRGMIDKKFIRITADEQNGYTADVTSTYEGYAYLNWIEDYQKHENDAAYVAHVKSNSQSLTINEHVVKSLGRDKLKAVEQTNVDLNDSHYLQDIGETLIMNPYIFSDFENPFKADSRKFPIDFIYPRNRSIVISIALPKNATIKKLPTSLTLVSEIGGGQFKFLCSATNNTINISCDFRIDQQIFNEGDYPILKAFFTEVSRKLNEPIEIQKGA
jgi:hypothetical protein